MITHFLDLNNLRVLIDSKLLDDNELGLIKRRLKFLFDQEDEFNAYYDSLSPAERYEEECEGKLFPYIYPFRPFIWFDDILHEKIISYMLLADIGSTVISINESMPYRDFNPYINGILRNDVIRLVDAKK